MTMTAAFQPRSIFSCVVNNGKIWLITGLSTQGKTATVYDDVWSSADGAHWTQAAATVAFSGRYAQTSVVYNNDLWVIGGNVGLAPFLNDVYSSSDGANWNQVSPGAAFSGRCDHTSLVFNGKMWVLGGLDSNSNPLNDVWHSP